MRLKEAVDTSSGKIIVAKDLDIKGTKDFVLVDDYQKFKKLLVRKQFNSYYEVFLKDKPWNFVIDLDLKKDHPLFEKPDVLVRDLIDIFWVNINGYAGFECQEEAVIVLESPQTSIKKSYHIIFRMKNVYFKNHLVCKDFSKCFNGEVDEAIYSANRSFRTIHSSKLVKPGNSFFINKELSNFPDDYDYTLNSFGSYIIQNQETKFIERRKLKKLKPTPDSLEDPILNDIHNIVLGLSPKRYTDRNLWLNVGFILKGLGDNLNIFKTFSRQWNNYNEKECEYTYNSLDIQNDYKLNFQKLVYLYNIDNPHKPYKNIIDYSNLEALDSDVSQFIYRYYVNQFICSSVDDDTFYYFNGNNYELEDGSYNLRLKIINEIKPLFVKNRMEIRKKFPDFNDYRNMNADKLVKMVSSGKRLNCLELVFYDAKFKKICDTKENLLAFTNGIYELDTGLFRQGLYDDYITLTTKTEYKSFVNTSRVEKILGDIFQDKKIYRYVMKIFSSMLYGRNKEEFFYIFTGSGGNGKGIIQDLFKYGLGDYFITGKTAIITASREESSGANSAIMALKGKRFCVFPEPNANDKLNVGTIKQFSGGDDISARALYKQEETFTPTFKMALCCNDLPVIENIDGGLRRRLKVIEFKTKFVDEVSKPSHKQKDETLKETGTIAQLGIEFINLLLEKFLPLYNKEGLKDCPDEINTYTKIYIDDNNVIKDFKEEFIEEGGHMVKKDIRHLYTSDTKFKKYPFKIFIKKLEEELDEKFQRDKYMEGQRYKDVLVGYSIKEE